MKLRLLAVVSVTLPLAAALPGAAGGLTLWLSFRCAGRWTRGSRLVLALLDVAALFVWAGWIAGPIRAVLAALLPSGAWRKEPGEAALR
jgi:hypothetical protein